MSDIVPICEKKDSITLDNIELEIWYDSDFKNSKTTLLFLKTFVELMEKGWTPLSLDWCSAVDKCKVFYCETKEKQVISAIVCFYTENNRQGWVLLSFTDPLWRKKGLNKILFPYVERYMKSKGAKSISGNAHVGNTPRIKASRENGMELCYVKMIKEI